MPGRQRRSKKNNHKSKTAKSEPVPTPKRELRSSKSVVFQQITQVVIPADSPPGQYTALIFITANGHGSAVFQRAPTLPSTVISRSPSNSAPFLNLGVFPTGSQNNQFRGWQRQFNLFRVNSVHMEASCSYAGGNIGSLTSQYIARDETGILCNADVPGTGPSNLGPLTYIESLENMKALKYSAFPRKVSMGINYKPILPAICPIEFLNTNNGINGYQGFYPTTLTPGVIFLQNFTLFETVTVPIVIATALMKTHITFCESALTTNTPVDDKLLVIREHARIRSAMQQRQLVELKEEVMPCADSEDEKPVQVCTPMQESDGNSNRFDSLTRSQLVQFIDTMDHSPAHLSGRVGEAKNPGPSDDFDL